MKKLIAVLLGINLIFISGCSSQPTPTASTSQTQEEVIKEFQDVIGSVNTADSATIESNIKVDMVVEENVVHIDMVSSIKTQDISSNPLMAMNMTMTVLGQDMNTNMYYTNGNLYSDVVGNKSVQEMDVETMLSQVQNQASMGSSSFDPDMIETITKSESNGNSVYDFTFSTEGIETYLGNYTQSAGISSNEVGSDIKVSEASGSLTVDSNNLPVSQTVKMDVELPVNGASIRMTVSGTIDYSDIGTTVVEIPDLSDFDGSESAN